MLLGLVALGLLGAAYIIAAALDLAALRVDQAHDASSYFPVQK